MFVPFFCCQLTLSILLVAKAQRLLLLEVILGSWPSLFVFRMPWILLLAPCFRSTHKQFMSWLFVRNQKWTRTLSSGMMSSHASRSLAIMQCSSWLSKNMLTMAALGLNLSLSLVHYSHPQYICLWCLLVDIAVSSLDVTVTIASVGWVTD